MSENEFSEDFTKILSQISTMKTYLTELNQNLKSLEKGVKKKMKAHDKIIQKSKGKGNKKLTGFAKPSYISKELCTFMAVPEGSTMARTDVTKYIIQYIKDKNLPDKNNRKIIKPDKNLKSLLNPNPNEDVTYFNIQKLMNKHFVSPNKN
jgi:chromatin remodeling complex protein RSC6